VAVLRKLARAGRWEGDETVVAYITGAGLKTAECVASRAETLTPVPASLRAVRERYAGLI
jgi:threonine synthase